METQHLINQLLELKSLQAYQLQQKEIRVRMDTLQGQANAYVMSGDYEKAMANLARMDELQKVCTWVEGKLKQVKNRREQSG